MTDLEKRLIDANALMDVIRKNEYPVAARLGSIDNGMFTVGIQQAVDEQPTVDAVEVVHGRWIQGESVLDKYGGGSIYHCSECGDWYHNFVPNYCPNCGAKMDGDTIG